MAVTKQVQTALSEEVSKKVAKWLLEKCFEPAKSYREQVIGDADWPLFRAMRDAADHYASVGREEPEDFPGFTANMTMPTIDTAKGIALLTPPVPEFVPPSTDPDDEEFATVLTALVGEFLWSVNKGRRKMAQAWDEAATVGTVFAKPFWNEDLYDFEGDVDVDVVQADEVFLDPTARGDNYGFVIHVARRPTIEVKYDEAHYNDHRLLVVPDDAPTQGQKEDSAEKWVDLTSCYEFWIKGYWLKALGEEVPEFKSQIDGDAEKWGMQIIIASEYVIKYNSHPWKSPRFPIAKFMYYPGIGNKRHYGTGEPHYLKDAQFALDDKFTQFLHMIAMIANKQRVISDGAVLDESELTSKPGQVIHVSGPANAAIWDLDPGSVPPALPNAISMIMRLFEIIPGMYEVNRGDTPGSIRAGVAIQALQRGGEGRTAQKSFNFDDFIVDIVMIWTDIMAVMYDDERVYRITGTFEAPATPEDASAEPLVDEFGQPVPPVDATGAPLPPQIKGYKEVKISGESFFNGDKRVPLDARVRVGMMIRSWDEWMQKMTEWMGAGIIDAQYAIENSNLPRKDGLLQRLQAMQTPPAAEAGTAAPLPAEGTPPMPTPDELNQQQQVIDMLLSQLEELEQAGQLPPGTTDKIRAQVEAEIAAGGDGSQALAAAQELIGGLEQASQSAMQQYGVPTSRPVGM